VQRFFSTSFAAVVLAAATGSAPQMAFAADADTVADMHDALKERWYTTEVVVFRTTNAAVDERILLQGERLSAAEERMRAGLASLKDLEESEPTDEFEGDPEEAINVLTLDPADSDTEELKRPDLDAEPWDGIKDYGAADNLNTLVARNMATWESELRARDGEWLSVDELTLNDAANKLDRSRSTEVLFHSGWIQSVPARGNGKPIEFTAGEAYTDSFSGEEQHRLSGNFTVTLGRYLHIRPTLFYTPVHTPIDDPINSALSADQIVSQARAAAAAARGEASAKVPQVRDLSSNAEISSRSALDRIRDKELAEQQMAEEDVPFGLQAEQDRAPYIRLDQSRRVRSGELHYLDHPELGVLVRITPVEAATALQEQFALLQ